MNKGEELTDIVRKVENGQMDSTVAFDRIFRLFDVSGQSELLLDFVRWQNRCSKWVTIPEKMVDDYIAWKKSSNSH